MTHKYVMMFKYRPHCMFQHLFKRWKMSKKKL